MIIQNLEISPNTYYTLDETAVMLRISRRRVRHLLETGRANGVKIGRSWRILGRDLLKLPRADDTTDSELTRSMMRLSEPAFMQVWGHDEDAVYDAE